MTATLAPAISPPDQTTQGLSPAEVRQAATEFFEQHADKRFRTPRDVEQLTTAALQATPVGGTVLEPIGMIARDGDVNAGHSMHDVMTALGLERPELHELACYCAYGSMISGAQMAYNLQAIG